MSRFARYMSLILALALCLGVMLPGALAASEEPEAPAEDGVILTEETPEPQEQPDGPQERPDEEMPSETDALEPEEEPLPLPEASEEPEELLLALDGDGDEEEPEETDGAVTGSWGGGFTWSFRDGVMTVSGSGDMAEMDEKPWAREVRDDRIISAVIGEGVTSLEYLFKGCGRLESVTLPAGLERIGAHTFESCTALREVIFDGDAAALTVDAYNDAFLVAAHVAIDRSGTCEEGLSWTVRNGVLTISGEGLMSIGYNSWNNPFPWAASADSVKTLVIEEGVYRISSYAFENFTLLESVSIPESVTSIGSGAFYGCRAIRTVAYAGTETQWYDIYIERQNGPLLAAAPYPAQASGQYGSDFSWSLEGTTLTITGQGDMPDAEVECPWRDYADLVRKVVVGSGATTVGAHAFSGFGYLQAVELPAGLRSVEDAAFYDCERLTEIALPAGTEEIGSGAFYGCAALETLTLPAGLESIGESAFCQSGLKAVAMPEGLASIGDYAFLSCEALESVSLPESLERVGDFAFAECESLTEGVYAGTTAQWLGIVFGVGNAALWKAVGIEPTVGGTFGSLTWKIEDGTLTISGEGAMPDGTRPPWLAYSDLITAVVVEEGVTTVCSLAFAYGDSIESVSLPAGILGVGGYAFYGCRSLSGLTLPEEVVYIGTHAFDLCISLRALDIPDGVTAIEPYTFEYCVSLRQLELPAELESIGSYAFLYCASLPVAVLPDTVTAIGDGAFQSCQSMVYVNLSSGLEVLADNVFYECRQLRAVIVPEGVTAIGAGAFYGCSSMAAIMLPKSLDRVDAYAFDGCDGLTGLYYLGTRAQWGDIDIDAIGNARLASAALYTEYDNDAETGAELAGADEAEKLLADVVEELAEGGGNTVVEEREDGALAAAKDDGKAITAQVVVTMLDASALPETDGRVIAAAAENGEVLAAVDIRVELLADGASIGCVRELAEKLRFRVELSAEQLEKLEDKGLVVVGVHDGRALLLTPEREDAVISFETDRFSTYAVVACGHAWGEWTVTREADYETAGERTHTCTVCGAVRTEGIPVLVREDPDPAPRDSGARRDESRRAGERAPGTGDESPVLLWTLLLASCAGALDVLGGKKRRG